MAVFMIPPTPVPTTRILTSPPTPPSLMQPALASALPESRLPLLWASLCGTLTSVHCNGLSPCPPLLFHSVLPEGKDRFPVPQQGHMPSRISKCYRADVVQARYPEDADSCAGAAPAFSLWHGHHHLYDASGGHLDSASMDSTSPC